MPLSKEVQRKQRSGFGENLLEGHDNEQIINKILRTALTNTFTLLQLKTTFKNPGLSDKESIYGKGQCAFFMLG